MYPTPEWLESLKIGDEVMLIGGFGPPIIRPVTHTTATQVHVGGMKFNRTTGRQIGAKGYRSFRIRDFNEEERARVQQRTLADIFANTPRHEWLSLPLAVLDAMHAVFTHGADEK